MAASVWMYSMSEAARPNSRPPRCTELTMPEVMVFWRAKGLPMATTNSPWRTSEERPRGSVGRGCCGRRGRSQSQHNPKAVVAGAARGSQRGVTLGEILMVAMSATWSTCCTAAS